MDLVYVDKIKIKIGEIFRDSDLTVLHCSCGENYKDENELWKHVRYKHIVIYRIFQTIAYKKTHFRVEAFDFQEICNQPKTN